MGCHSDMIYPGLDCDKLSSVGHTFSRPSHICRGWRAKGRRERTVRKRCTLHWTFSSYHNAFLKCLLKQWVVIVDKPGFGGTWASRRHWRSNITICWAWAGSTSFGPGILLRRRSRHHLLWLLVRGGLWGRPTRGGLPISHIGNLIIPRAVTISTPRP